MRGLSEATWRAPAGRIDVDELIDNCRANLQLARQLERDPLLVSQLMAMVARFLAYDDLCLALHHDLLPRVKRQRVLEMLAKWDVPVPPVGEALRGECALVFSVLQYSAAREQPGPDEELNEIILLIRDGRASPTEAAGVFLDLCQNAARHTEQQFSPARYAALEKMVRRASDENAVTKRFFPAYWRLWALNRRCEATRRATRLIYALHTYRDTWSRWPEDLRKLPDRIYAEFAADPFRDGLFAYSLGDGQPRLYSVSLDGQDNGGVHDARWTNGLKTPGTDYVFWPMLEEESGEED